MRSHSYLNTAAAIIRDYNGSIPLTAWLKQFFRADKKFGSTDRKNISHASYCYFRLGGAFQDKDIEERLLIALFLCSDASNIFLSELKPEWNAIVASSVSEKIDLLSIAGEIATIFPFAAELSDGIDLQQFNRSFLVQPDLFLRVRPGKRKMVEEQLQKAGLDFVLQGDSCVRLSNQSKLDEILSIDEEVVVQDLNSQKTIEPFKSSAANSSFSLWDCCAASGGKSMLFYDHFPGVQLTVSDVRESILINLRNRFKRAGIENYNWFVADVAAGDFSIQKKFDLVVCDAPCSGSGTWSRTPEQIHFFKKEKITYYSNLQKSIVVNASKALKKSGCLLYITCSVFKKENEEVVQFIQEQLPLQLKSMQYLKGYDEKADTLFVALFSAL